MNLDKLIAFQKVISCIAIIHQNLYINIPRHNLLKEIKSYFPSLNLNGQWGIVSKNNNGNDTLNLDMAMNIVYAAIDKLPSDIINNLPNMYYPYFATVNPY